METIINTAVICFTLSVIIFVEKLMYRAPISKQKIADYQKVLDKMDKNAKEKYGLEWNHDSLTEILKERTQSKSFTLIFSGVFLVFVLLGLATFISIPFSSIGIICMSGIILMCYGLIKISESRKFAVIVLLFVFTVGTLMNLVFTKLMTASPYAYYYLCALILVIGIFTLVPQVKKFASNH